MYRGGDAVIVGGVAGREGCGRTREVEGSLPQRGPKDHSRHDMKCRTDYAGSLVPSLQSTAVLFIVSLLLVSMLTKVPFASLIPRLSSPRFYLTANHEGEESLGTRLSFGFTILGYGMC